MRIESFILVTSENFVTNDSFIFVTGKYWMSIWTFVTNDQKFHIYNKWKSHICNKRKFHILTSENIIFVTRESLIFVTIRSWMGIWKFYICTLALLSAQKYISKKKLKGHCELFRATSISDGPLVTIMLTTQSWTIWEFLKSHIWSWIYPHSWIMAI